MRSKLALWRRVFRLLRGLVGWDRPPETAARSTASTVSGTPAAALWPWDSCDTCALPIPPG